MVWKKCASFIRNNMFSVTLAFIVLLDRVAMGKRKIVRLSVKEIKMEEEK